MYFLIHTNIIDIDSTKNSLNVRIRISSWTKLSFNYTTIVIMIAYLT
jgi:hypothetical protein